MNFNTRSHKNKKRSNKKQRTIKGAARDDSSVNQWELVPDSAPQGSRESTSIALAPRSEVSDPETLAMLPPLDAVAQGSLIAETTLLEKELLMEQLMGTQRQNEEVLALARDSVAFIKTSSQQSLILLKEQVQSLKEKELILMEENARAQEKIQCLEEELLKERKLREDLETLQKFQ